MKRIKIFLASSIKELESDRDKLQAFIDQLNEFYCDYGIRISLFRCENADKAVALDGKQTEFDKEIRESELCLFLFFRKLGDYTRHEFDVALESFKNSEKPKIVTYFKYVDSPEEATGEVKSFMTMLDSEIKHYYNIYQNVDTLKLGVLMQLKLMKLDAEEPKVEKGKVMFGNREIADISNLPVFSGNGSLKKLNEELRILTEQYYDLRRRMRENPDNDGLYDEYGKVASKKAETEKKCRETEKAVLEAMRTMTENTARGNLSQRQVAAYRAFEKGDYADALEILNLNEILEELNHNESMAEGYAERIQINVNELLQRIEVLKADGVDKDDAKEIKDIYETVYNLIKKYNLEKSPLYDYALFLDDQNDYNMAIRIAKQLEYFYDDPECATDENSMAALYNILGNLYCKTNHFKESEEMYLKSIVICKRLSKKNPEAHEPNLATSYNNLGNLYSDTNRLKESEEMHLKAIEIREKFSEKNPEAYEPDLASSYCNLGNLYYKTSHFKESEEMYLKAIEIRERFSEKNPEAYEPDLAISYNNLGILYKNTNRLKESEEMHLKAFEIYERFSEKNPEAYEPDLAASYNNLGNLYSDTNRLKESEEMYLKAIEIRERLSEKNPEAYEPDLAKSYNNLGLLYSDTNRLKESEEMYLKAVKIAKKYPQNQMCAQILNALEG